MTLLTGTAALLVYTWIVISAMWWPVMPDSDYLIAIALIVIIFIIKRQWLWVTVFFAMFVVVTQASSLRYQSKWLYKSGQDITITATVNSYFKQLTYGYEVIVTVLAINGKNVPFLFRPNIVLNSTQPIELGAKITTPIQLKRVSGRLNRAGFDKEKYYFSNQWVAQAKIESNSHLLIRTRGHWRAWLYQKLIQEYQASDYRRFYNALIFGDRNGLQASDWHNLRQTGLSHLVAISGLHVGIIFSIMWTTNRSLIALICRFYIGRYRQYADRYAYLLNLSFSLLLTFGYCALAQFSVPTVRAFIMLVLLALFQWQFVRVSGQTMLAWCSAILVTLLPNSAASTSFWLSMVAVACLMFIAQLGRNRVTLYSLVKTHILLSLAFIPITLLLFQGISPLMPIYNLIFVPWFSFCVIPMILIAILCSLLWGGTPYVWKFVDLLFMPIDYALIHSKGGWINIAPHWAWLGMIVFFSFTLYRWVSLRYFGLLGLIAVFGRGLSVESQRFAVNFMDVGHGLAVILQQGSRAVVYDTGMKRGDHSVAQEVITPSLRAYGVKNLDGLILSHSDNDHAGGTLDIINAWSPHWVIRPDASEGERICKKGTQWQWEKVTFTALWPPESVARAYNPHSCVVLVEYKTKQHSDPIRVLLTGDIDKVAEILVFRELEKLNIDILSVPHHGSRTSSSKFLHDKLNADFAVASTQWDSHWNIPHPEVKKGYLDRNIAWIETGKSGQVRFTLQGESLQVSKFRHDYLTPWYRQMLRYGVE